MNPRNVAGPRPTTGGTADDHHGRGIGSMLPAGAGESCSCGARFADQRNLSRHRIDNGPGHERGIPEPPAVDTVALARRRDAEARLVPAANASLRRQVTP